MKDWRMIKMQSVGVFLGLGGGAENYLSSTKLVELTRPCLNNKNKFIKEVKRRSDVFFLPPIWCFGGRVWTQHVIPRELQRIWTFPNFDRLTGGMLLWRSGPARMIITE